MGTLKLRLIDKCTDISSKHLEQNRGAKQGTDLGIIMRFGQVVLLLENKKGQSNIYASPIFRFLGLPGFLAVTR